jgi:FAD/FMN-containing dehydrogenase
VPVGLVVPRTLDDVVATVATCRECGAPVLSRGGCTSLAGECCDVAVIMVMCSYEYPGANGRRTFPAGDRPRPIKKSQCISLSVDRMAEFGDTRLT